VGEDRIGQDCRDTPERRGAGLCRELRGLWQDRTPSSRRRFDEDHDELVLVKDIPMYSTCEHHLCPSTGSRTSATSRGGRPGDRACRSWPGWSEVYARRPQVQERMTSQIADALADVLKPRGVLVVIEAEHLCMAMRGIRKPGSSTVTSAVRGIFRENPATRSEAMSLVLGR
jgi:GTP cyclohydrolase I